MVLDTTPPMAPVDVVDSSPDDDHLIAAATVAEGRAESHRRDPRGDDPLQRNDAWARSSLAGSPSAAGSERKCPAVSSPARHDDMHFATKEDLSDGLAGLSGKMANAIKNSMANMQGCLVELNSTLSGSVEQSMQSMEAKFSKGMAQVNERIDTHDVKLAEQGASLDALKKELAELKAQQTMHTEKVVAVAKTIQSEVDARVADDPLFVRPPIRTLLRLNVQQTTEKAKIAVAVGQWLEGTFESGQYKLDGPDSGKQWSLHFIAPTTTAASMAGRARNLLRNPDGTWREIMVADQTLFIGPDVPPNVRKVNMGLRRVEKAIRCIHPTQAMAADKAQYHPQKSPQGVIYIGCEDLLVVSAPNQYDEVEILWNNDLVTKNGIDKEKILEAFTASARFRARSIDTRMWCKSHHMPASPF